MMIFQSYFYILGIVVTAENPSEKLVILLRIPDALLVAAIKAADYASLIHPTMRLRASLFRSL